MQKLIIAENITKNYGQEKIIKGVTVSIEESTFTAILGHSGSGKSTLLNILSGLIKPTAGTVMYQSKKINALSEAELADWKRCEVSNIFQNYLLLNNLNVAENIRIGISPSKTPLEFDRLVRILEIGDILDKFPSQLSGGQQQRVAIARAIIKSPSILFCDEATGSLDEENSKKVVELLHEIKTTFGVTVLFITHNKQIARTADRIITIKNGLVSQDEENRNLILPSDMAWG